MSFTHTAVINPSHQLQKGLFTVLHLTQWIRAFIHLYKSMRISKMLVCLLFGICDHNDNGFFHRYFATSWWYGPETAAASSKRTQRDAVLQYGERYRNVLASRLVKVSQQHLWHAVYRHNHFDTSFESKANQIAPW